MKQYFVNQKTDVLHSSKIYYKLKSIRIFGSFTDKSLTLIILWLKPNKEIDE